MYFGWSFKQNNCREKNVKSCLKSLVSLFVSIITFSILGIDFISYSASFSYVFLAFVLIYLLTEHYTLLFVTTVIQPPF